MMNRNNLQSVQLLPKDMTRIQKIIYDNYGVDLPDKKSGLVKNRLLKILRKYSLDSFEAYIQKLDQDESGVLLKELIDHISTNHTYFWREHSHFEFISDTVLPFIKSNMNKMKNSEMFVWCCACSSGEESYTLAMLMKEVMESHIDLGRKMILASDISTSALEKAQRGIYSKESIKKLPLKYHRSFDTIDKDTVSISSDLQKMVHHQRINLIEPYPFNHQFQIIMCRNVLIYFDKDSRNEVINKLYNVLAPGGLLFVGKAESLSTTQTLFNRVESSIYQKRHIA